MKVQALWGIVIVLMSPSQEDALYEFLENVTEPFTLEKVTAFVRMRVPPKTPRLASEIASFIDSRNIAFRLGPNRWVSRRGCFEPARFVISPTRLELLNGILIPGHRCLPFANPILMPQEYVFYWHGSPVPVTTTEGPPEDFYPYYMIFGEEYAPQYVARDNPENETAFNSDPYEDPPEVSIHTLDMRNLYRETAFVPGDRFMARTLDWKAGIFEIERVAKDAWSPEDLQAWLEAAEEGFEESFKRLGAGVSTDEQIAYAYWFGGKRMRETPAFSLEDFLYEKTDRIEATAYGIETRFWYAGREIPDRKTLEGPTISDRTIIEDILYRYGIPVSEYVVQSYVRDALYRNDPEISRLMERIVPPTVGMEQQDLNYLVEYVVEVYEEFSENYSLFTDNAMGPIRQRVGELHTAVIDLVTRLQSGDIDLSWLPKHTFVVLSQIQGHAASLMEDLDMDNAPSAPELEFMDNSLDSMIETYEDIKELIEESMGSFRRNNISIVKNFGMSAFHSVFWRTLQLGLGGTDVWRRLTLPENQTLLSLHKIIQMLFGWDGSFQYRFTGDNEALNLKIHLEELSRRGFAEILYEYGPQWTVKIMFLSRQEVGKNEHIRCVAGAGAAPPLFIDGPLRYKKFIAALERGDETERRLVQDKLGAEFHPQDFDMERCNRYLESQLYIKKQKRGLI